MKGNRISTHPGALLKGELAERGLSANRLALALGVPAGRILDILRQRRGITPDTAIRLAAFFGGEPRFWLNLQAAHDLSRLEVEKGQAIRAQVRVPAAWAP
ncbi:MAG: HigA family addiction module antidote protein [Desulfarculus sp.]|nr:HigA family addiction module antidote protein [Desulfarculus sp.]